jgi:anti-sigma factor RsiW
MNCQACQDLLQQHLDGGGIADRTSLDTHLRTCPECTALHAAGRRLQHGLRLLSIPTLSAGLTDRITARLRAEHRARLRRRWVTVGALAASVVAVVLAWWYWPVPQPSQPVGPPPVVKAPEQPVPDVGPGPDADSLGQSVSAAGSAVASLTTRAADQTLAQTKLWLPAVPSSLGNLELETPLDPPSVSLRDAGQGVSVGLEPVANSAKRAVDLFLRELPPMNLEEKPQY